MNVWRLWCRQLFICTCITFANIFIPALSLCSSGVYSLVWCFLPDSYVHAFIIFVHFFSVFFSVCTTNIERFYFCNLHFWRYENCGQVNMTPYDMTATYTLTALDNIKINFGFCLSVAWSPCLPCQAITTTIAITTVINTLSSERFSDIEAIFTIPSNAICVEFVMH